MAVPSILVAVIADGVLENGRCWAVCWDEKRVRAGTREVGVRIDDRRKRRFRPRDFKVFLAATADEAEPIGGELKACRSYGGRSSLRASGARSDEQAREAYRRMWPADDNSVLIQQCCCARVNMPAGLGRAKE